jgi:hypothetical protein
MKTFGATPMNEVKLLFDIVWPHGPWPEPRLREMMKLWTDVASMGGTKALYETVEGIPFAKLKYVMDTLRHVRLIGDRAPQGLLETLLEICAQAGGAKKLVQQLEKLDMRYFDDNMLLLERAELTNPANIKNRDVLEHRISKKGGLHRFLELTAKQEAVIHQCRYCKNDLYLQRSMQTNFTKKWSDLKDQKFIVPDVNQKGQPVGGIGMRLTGVQSMPPGMRLPPLTESGQEALPPLEEMDPLVAWEEPTKELAESESKPPERPSST